MYSAKNSITGVGGTGCQEGERKARLQLSRENGGRDEGEGGGGGRDRWPTGVSSYGCGERTLGQRGMRRCPGPCSAFPLPSFVPGQVSGSAIFCFFQYGNLIGLGPTPCHFSWRFKTPYSAPASPTLPAQTLPCSSCKIPIVMIMSHPSETKECWQRGHRVELQSVVIKSAALDIDFHDASPLAHLVCSDAL